MQQKIQNWTFIYENKKIILVTILYFRNHFSNLRKKKNSYHRFYTWENK